MSYDNNSKSMYTNEFQDTIQKIMESKPYKRHPGKAVIEVTMEAKPEYMPAERKIAPYRTTPYMYNRMEYNFSRRQETLQERLAYWIEKNNITVTMFTKYVNDYAKRWGYSFHPSTIYSYLIRRCSPKIDRVYLLAAAMNVSPQWLMGYGPRKIANNPNVTVLDDIREKKHASQVANATRARAAHVAKAAARKKVAA